MKDRTILCEFYVCAGVDCKKGKKEVTMTKCKNCKKYRPRKTGNVKQESIKSKKDKIKEKDFKKYQKEY